MDERDRVRTPLRLEVEDRIVSTAEERSEPPSGLAVYYFSFAIYGPLIIWSSRKGVVVGKVGSEYVSFKPLLFGFPLAAWCPHFRGSTLLLCFRVRFSPSLFDVMNGREG